MRKFTITATLCVMLGLLAVGQAFGADCAADYVAPENPVWDGSATQEPCTIKGYFIIDNAQKLAWYAAKDSKGVWNYTKGNAKLTADIDLDNKLWTPIAPGDGGTKYNKIFDGNGHVIKNMYINGSELAQKDKKFAQNLGLVGTLGGGTIKNLILEDINIQASTNAGDILGRTDSQISVGAFVGWMSDNVSKNVVDNCVVASGTIRTTGNGQGVGGIVGNAKIGTISNCLSLVEIHTSGSDAYIGGIIGITKTNVSVSSCVYAGPGLVNTGTNGLVGGIAGNVFSGKLATKDNYFEGENISGVGGSICTAPDPKNCTPETSAASVNNAQATDVDFTNVENVACALNGTNEDGSCKEEPWSVGQTGLSLNGYGKDGYKITFDANEGSFDGVKFKNKFLQAGMTITADEIGTPSRDYYSFVGWAFAQNATEPAENLGVVSQRDTVFAVWEKKIKVIFDANGGAFPDEAEVKDVYITKGDPITVDGLGSLPVTYCEEYSASNPSQCLSTMYFTGWKNDAGTTVDFNNHNVFATEDVTYKAIWTDVKTYSVTFHANNNTTVDIVVYVDDGETLTSRPTDPTMDGYDFAGWYDGDLVFDFDSEIEMSKDLYAHWTPKQYDITYVLSEGGKDRGDNPVLFTLGEGLLALNPPTAQDGYTFEGWFYDSDFKQKATAIDRNVVDDKTFYAKWSKIQYRIMYLADNSSQGAVTDQFKEYGTPITLESAGHFNRKGYAELGWATVANGEKVYEFGASYEENAALTLYPVWSDPIEYTITYVCEVCTGSNPSEPRTYTINDTKDGNLSIYNPTFSSSEYEFKGWYWDENYTKRTTNIPMGALGDTTLYGKMLKKYTISYELNGGTKHNSRTSYTSETTTFALGKATGRKGYTFAGWYANANFEGDAVTEIPLGSTGDKIFYAKWIRKYGAITIVDNLDGTNSAVINGNYGGGDEPNSEEADAVEITSGISVNSVTLDRTFNAGKIATLYVPFEIDAENVVGTEVYKFKTVVWNENDRRWKFKVSTATKVMPNTPYVIIPEGTQVTFDIATSVSLNTTTVGEPTAANNWNFVGAYQYEKFTLDNNNPVYLFADQARDGAKLGEFVKIADGAHINPMRAYLVYHKGAASPKSAGDNLGSSILLPDELDIEIENENGIVVQTGRLNTVTGEVRMDRWFDLKGRRLNSKPTVKGTYYKNGKRVIVK